MLKVKGHRLLIKRADVEEQIKVGQDAVFKDAGADELKKLGFEIPVSKEQKNQYRVAVEEGLVVQVGNMAWKDKDLGFGLDGWEPWCNVGDTILMARYCGKEIQDPEIPGKEGLFYMINDMDVQAVIKEA